ncbi:MAG: hypothetical protein M2R45_05444 [Verrucomicrobia subdivision 3 bacterium]|nr:hypothetical protein [Limisphaerales bacterium]MCS1417790.1 hypothetical protein [Limisphaerales bacterium]
MVDGCEVVFQKFFEAYPSRLFAYLLAVSRRGSGELAFEVLQRVMIKVGSRIRVFDSSRVILAILRGNSIFDGRFLRVIQSHLKLFGRFEERGIDQIDDNRLFQGIRRKRPGAAPCHTRPPCLTPISSSIPSQREA